MRFSVVIPLFNKAPYVEKALRSVISQTFQDFEIIVVDDGSSDNSYIVAKQVLDASPIEHCLIQQSNSGVSTARNNGVTASKGDFICFLDADDWWSSTFLERMDYLIHEHPEAGIYGTNYYYVKNGRQRICVANAETGIINYCKVYSEGLAMPLTSISVSLSRSVFNEFGGFKPNLRLGEDFDLWIRIALKYKVAFLSEPLAFYFQDSNKEWRAVGRLHSPQEHMLWNLSYLEEEERSNHDYKQLIDKLRVNNLFPYYISNQYREAAKHELEKVDWSIQPFNKRLIYKLPIYILKSYRIIMRTGSSIKQVLAQAFK